jgi:hypothetical protein
MPSPDIMLTNIVEEFVDSALLNKVKYLPSLPANYKINVSTGIARKIKYYSISFIPLRKISNSGRIVRIKSFSIAINPGILKNKNESSIVKNVKAAIASHSVLSSGTWVKIKIKDDGVYKLTYDQLKQIGITNPENVRVYGNGGGMLPLKPLVPRYDDLLEIPIMFNENAGNSAGNYILFYAQGPNTWKYDTINDIFVHTVNQFSDYSFYFLTSDLGRGKTIPLQNSLPPSGSENVSSFDDYQYHEADYENLIRSGAEWFGEVFNVATQYSFDFDFQNIDNSVNVKLNYYLAAQSDGTTYFSLLYGNQLLKQETIPSVNTSNTDGPYAQPAKGSVTFTADTDNITINILYDQNGDINAIGYLNYLELNARRKLLFNGPQMFFRDTRTVGNGQKAQFNLGDANNNTLIWDITDIHNLKQISGTLSGSNLNFVVSTDSLLQFIAFDQSSQMLAPITNGDGTGLVPNQDLHGLDIPDLIIVSPPDTGFLNQANILANWRRSHDGLKVVVATTEQIYNEFSSGQRDVAAIRDFVKMFYDRAGDNLDNGPKYLLLFGTGTYDNKTIDPNNFNLIPTYESEESLMQDNSYVTDDFFGWLDDNGSDVNALLDIGVGRLTLKTRDDAVAVVNKLINYDKPVSMADWRNILCFIADADDDDSNHAFMIDADNLCDYVNQNYPQMVIQKIYLEAYPEYNSAIGETFPDVNIAINNRVNKGALIVNYTGHGGEIQLSHENVVTVNQILSWENINALNLFVTAACQFSQFDDVDVTNNRTSFNAKTSAGEYVLLNPVGGGIGLFSTTREVYEDENQELNSQFYHCVFARNEQGKFNRLGDVMRITKNNTDQSINKLNFSLLADPSMMLAFPKNVTIITDSINGHLVSNGPDSLSADTVKALSMVTIKGHINDDYGTKATQLNGIIYPTVFDKLDTINTLNNNGDAVYTFTDRPNIIYKGASSVVNGDFTFTFLTPKDINYIIGGGKIDYYAKSGNTDFSGYTYDFSVGGLVNNPTINYSGPVIQLYMNDTTFVSGGITNSNPNLLAKIFSINGINATGYGVGHDITAVLDSDVQNEMVLNDFYQSDENTYQSGSILYHLSNLSEGEHTISLEVWDSYDNSSEAEINFVVTGYSNFVINNLRNYPNPFSEETQFVFNHNKPDQNLNIVISIYNLSGSLVTVIHSSDYCQGFQSTPIVWNLSRHSVSQGIYVYTMMVKSQDGETAEKQGKLVIIR